MSTPYQTAISALETLKDLLTPTASDTATRINLRAAKRRLAALRTRPASLENCAAIAGEQQLISTLRRKLATAQGTTRLRIDLRAAERRLAALRTRPASVENCAAIAREQQLIDTLRHRLTTAQDTAHATAQLRTALHILEHAAAALPGGPAAPEQPQPKAAPSSGMFDIA